MPQATRTPTTLIPTARRAPPATPAVTEHTPTRRAPRRRFLLEAGATLALSLGATAAVLAPDPTWGAPAADAGPDAELIAACRAFDALEVQERALYNSAHTIEDEDRVEPEAAALSAQQTPLVAIICGLRATTPAGHLARARTLALLYGAPPDLAMNDGVRWEKRMAAAMGRDLVPEGWA